VKILIVDDDADLLALVAFALTQAGYVVVKRPMRRRRCRSSTPSPRSRDP